MRRPATQALSCVSVKRKKLSLPKVRSLLKKEKQWEALTNGNDPLFHIDVIQKKTELCSQVGFFYYINLLSVIFSGNLLLLFLL